MLYRVCLFVDVNKGCGPQRQWRPSSLATNCNCGQNAPSAHNAGFINGMQPTTRPPEQHRFRDRRHAISAVGLEWRFLRNFSVLGQYDYRWQKYKATPAAPTETKSSSHWCINRTVRPTIDAGYYHALEWYVKLTPETRSCTRFLMSDSSSRERRL